MKELGPNNIQALKLLAACADFFYKKGLQDGHARTAGHSPEDVNVQPRNETSEVEDPTPS